LYWSSALETMLGSTTREFNGVDTTTAVTFAPMAFARAMPCLIAAFDSSDPSVGSRICLYMGLLLPPCWDRIEARRIDLNQAQGWLRRRVTWRAAHGPRQRSQSKEPD
jgi:hypothetical protein